MSTPILATKLYIPRPRTELVPRPRLTRRLEESLTHTPSLTLISAPPGFGKTTLLSEWLSDLRFTNNDLRVKNEQIPNPKSKIVNRQVAWVSLDEQDNDPVRFWSYLVVALDKVQPGLETNVLPMLQARQAPPIEETLTVLINTLTTAPQVFILILDDYHLIEQVAIHQAFAFFLDHLPPQMHLILISRTDPPLPLTRFRVRNQLNEIRQNDLRFTPQEAANFLNQVMGLNLSLDDIAALENRTEGWVAGLQLAALSMQGRRDVQGFVAAFTGSHHYIIDYLAEEVLSQQPDHIQAFLLKTSILERLHGPLCDAVLGRLDASRGDRRLEIRDWRLADVSPIEAESPITNYQLPISNLLISQQTLEHLEQANLFLIPLDDERRWYRYHHLFADFLREYLQKMLTPAEITTLHQRASRWYAANDLPTEAVYHALAAQDIDRAVQLIEQLSMDLLLQGEAITLHNWLDALPEATVGQHPRLGLSLAWAKIILNRFDGIEEVLLKAERSLAESSPDNQKSSSRTSLEEMRGEATAIRSMIFGMQGQTEEAIALAEQSLAKISPDDLVGVSILKMHLGNLYENVGNFPQAITALSEAVTTGQKIGSWITILSAAGNLADLYTSQGQLSQAAHIYQELRDFLEKESQDQGQLSLAGRTYLGLAEIAREQNNLPEALKQVKMGLSLARQGHNLMGTFQIGHIILARILQAQGDPTGALAAIHEVTRLVDETFPAFRWAEAVQTRLWLAQSNLPAANHWAKSYELLLGDAFNYLKYPGEYTTLVRVHIAQEGFDEALNLLERMQTAEERLGRNGRLLEIYLLYALALHAQGSSTQALPSLKQALPIAEAGGYVRLFVDEGLPMADLLHKAARTSSQTNYIYKLLDAFETQASSDHTQQTIENRKSKIENLIEPLSDRELEVLHLIADGLSNQEIADTLVIAEGTVKKHIHNIFGKLAVRRRTQVVLRARELGLL